VTHGRKKVRLATKWDTLYIYTLDFSSPILYRLVMPCQAATGYQLLASIPFFPFQYRSPRLTPTFPQVLNPPVGSSNLCQFCCPIRLRPGKVDLPCLLQSYVYSHISSFPIFLPTIASSRHGLGVLSWSGDPAFCSPSNKCCYIAPDLPAICH
jgi:hypothetical protein